MEFAPKPEVAASPAPVVHAASHAAPHATGHAPGPPPAMPPDHLALLPWMDDYRAAVAAAPVMAMQAHMTELKAASNASLLLATKDETDDTRGRWHFLNALDRVDDPAVRRRMMEDFAQQSGQSRAACLFDRAGSMLSGPGTLKRLAQLAVEDGRNTAALAYLDRAIDHLRRFPLGGRGARRLESQLAEMRAGISIQE